MKRFVLTGAACTLVAFFLSFLIHGVLLAPYYNTLVEKGVFRSPEEASGYTHFMIIAHVLIGFAFAWIFIRGIEQGRAWYMQGIRFAIAVICLTTIPTYFIYYVVQPLPGELVVRQIIFDSIVVIILGLVAAVLNRDRATASGD